MKNKNLFNFAIIAAILFVFVLGCSNGNKNSNTNSVNAVNNSENKESIDTTTEKAKTKPDKSEKTSSTPAPSETAGVTMENFSKLKTGMKYDEVVKILGKEGEVLSENEMGGYRTVMYKWDGEGDSSWGANMNAMFQNGKLVSKSQFGLK